MSKLFTDYETIIPEEIVEKIEEPMEKVSKREKRKKNVTTKTVVVEIKNLNVRKGPGIKFDKLKEFLKPGEYEIAEEKDGYGRIAGTNNWIAMKFTK